MATDNGKATHDGKEVDIRYILCGKCGEQSLLVYNVTMVKFMACCDTCKTLNDLDAVALPDDSLN